MTPSARHRFEALCRRFGERLATFKVPARIAFRQEPLPRNANGKILKRELRGVFG